ncbi:hypothetical protein AYO49_04325 [Verrucomicrobiaceae bacterium SCGC AG-212-N21]|nr:hypothetical protein AYO49_04325 [Verrucomicrobiaceae bacterium SCGC AG-212-N21]
MIFAGKSHQQQQRSGGRPSALAVLGIVTVMVLVVASLLSSAMRRWDMDLTFSQLWWHAPHTWFGERSSVCWFLNKYGPAPGILLGVGAGVVLMSSLLRRAWRGLAMPALYVLMAFVLGPGLLVNGVLKHSWARARPKELVEFGGTKPYERIFTEVKGSLGRSFPSGHASSAFVLSALGFAAAIWGTRQGMWAGLALGAVWGALVGWSRIASGAHFLSDVMWSAVLVTCVNFLTLLPFVVASHASRKSRQVESFA